MSVVPWTYDKRPDTRTTNVRVGIWLFLASEAMFFGSLFSGYVLLRTGAPVWPRETLNVPVALLETAVLVAATLLLPRSGVSRAPTRARLLLSGALACVFLLIKLSEYNAKLAAGLHPSANVMLACWFTLTGIHALHVAGGIGANIWVARTAGGTNASQLAERLHATRLYWYFVDLVWLIILVSFYFI